MRIQNPKCKVCKRSVPRNELRLRKNGTIKESICLICRKKRVLMIKAPYRFFLPKIKCCICGFQGEECQLDYDHIDGNHKNNLIKNLRIVCANCHRLHHHH